MQDNFNTIAGWALGAAIVALGGSSVSSHYFKADKPHRPHEMGYEIEGVVSSDGGEEAVPLATLLASADLAKGEQSFKKCVSCHTITPGGANGIGPNLHAAVGVPIGKHVAGFAYSSALSGHGGNWDFANLDLWLANPKKFAPGTKMTYAGMSNAEERASLIAYMNAQGSNLPLPAAAPAAAEAAPAASGAAAEAGAAPATEAAAAAKPAG